MQHHWSHSWHKGNENILVGDVVLLPQAAILVLIRRCWYFPGFHHSQPQRHPSVCTFLSRLERLLSSQEIYFFLISKPAISVDKALPHPSPTKHCLLRASSFCLSGFRALKTKGEGLVMVSVIKLCFSILKITACSLATAANVQHCRGLPLAMLWCLLSVTFLYSAFHTIPVSAPCS